jgi:hypothetical protein
MKATLTYKVETQEQEAIFKRAVRSEDAWNSIWETELFLHSMVQESKHEYELILWKQAQSVFRNILQANSISLENEY